MATAGTTFTENQADYGGGIYLATGSGAALSGVTVEDNWANTDNGGGGITIQKGGVLVIVASTVEDNHNGNIIHLT